MQVLPARIWPQLFQTAFELGSVSRLKGTCSWQSSKFVATQSWPATQKHPHRRVLQLRRCHGRVPEARMRARSNPGQTRVLWKVSREELYSKEERCSRRGWNRICYGERVLTREELNDISVNIEPGVLLLEDSKLRSHSRSVDIGLLPPLIGQSCKGFQGLQMFLDLRDRSDSGPLETHAW